MHVTVRHVDGCPHWRTTDARLREALDATGHGDVSVDRETVESAEDAERLGFVGSPTVLIDGVDPFLVPGAPVGLACRIYRTPEGLRGSPTIEQLVDVLR